MQKREIKNRIKTVKCYKKRIKDVSNSLFKEYKSGKTGYSEYFFRLSKFLKGKTEEQWYSYYDSCTKNLENRIDKPKEIDKKDNGFLLLLIISIFTLGILLFNNYTGFVVYDNYSSDNLTFSTNATLITNECCLMDNKTSNNIQVDNYTQIGENESIISNDSDESFNELEYIFNIQVTVFNKTFDLSSVSANITILGDDASDNSSWAIASGDINDDNVDDVIIGAYGADPGGRVSAGETYVIDGSSSYSVGKIFDLNSVSANITILGDDANDYSGSAISSGDINNDNIKDIIIGAKYADPAGGTDAGETYIIYGGSYSAGKTFDLSSVSANITILGDNAYDNLGISVASGDIDGDAINDIIIGAYGSDRSGFGAAGGTYVIYGSSYSIGKIFDLNSVSANITIYGEDYNDWSGISVASGDINGDNIDDIIIGAYGGNGSTNSLGDAGETYVIYGGSYPHGKIFNLSSVSADITIYGDDAGDYSGYSVASGDINGDNIDDIIIGAYGGDGSTNSLGDAGETYVIYGGSYSAGKIFDLNSVKANITIYGDDDSDRSGYSVASGDINNDNIDDVIIGAYLADPTGGSSAGETYVIYGGSYSTGKIFDLDLVWANLTVFGTAASDYSGAAVASGDINKDSISDILIGAPLADPAGGSAAGETYIIFGPNALPYFTSHLNSKTYPKKNENINLSINVNDDSDIDYVRFSTNDSGTWNNYTFKPIATTSHFNYTNLKVASTRGKVVGYAWFANDTASNINRSKNSTDAYYFFRVQNTVPTFTGNPTINETSPKTNDIINCTLAGTTYSDVDNDAASEFYFEWYEDGVLIYNTQTTANSTLDLGWPNLDKNDEIGCRVLANDGTVNSTTWLISTDNATIANTAPTMTGAIINNTNPYTNDYVNCTVTASDADSGDSLTFYYKWYDDYVTNGSIFTSSVLDLSTSGWDKTDDVGCLALVNDGTTNSSWFTSTTNATIQNSAPTVNVDTTFANATNNHSMIVWADFSDADGDSDMSACKIFVQNTTGWDSETPTPSNGNCTTLLDYNIDGYIPNVDLGVTVQVCAGDDYTNSTLSNNTLVNHLPAVSTSTLTPATPVWSDDLNCTASASDVDSDSLTYYFRWYKNNTLDKIYGKNSNTMDLTSGNTTNNDNWKCGVIAFDAYDNSSEKISSSVLIGSGNNAPVIDYAEATTALTRINSTLTNPTNNNTWVNFTVQSTDTEVDPKTTYICKTNGFNAGAATCTGGQWCSSSQSTTTNQSCRYDITGAETLQSYNWYAHVLDNVGLVSSSIGGTFAVNHPPKIRSVNITETNPYTITDLNCNYTFSDSDSGDADNSNFVWFNTTDASNPMKLNKDNSILDSSNTTKNEIWLCQVTAKDNHAYEGNILNSSSATIQNSAPTFTGAPTINETSPKTNDIINCSLTGTTYSDVDNDAASEFYFEWYEDGVLIYNTQTTANSTLDLGWPNLDKNDEIGCRVLANDGTVNSTTWLVSTTNATIQNTAPTINVDTTFANATNNHSMTVWADFSDADGDSDMSACKIFVQNTTGWDSEAPTPVNGNCSTLLDYDVNRYIPKVDLGVTVQVYDNVDYTNSTAKNNTLVNHLPTMSTAVINNTTPFTNDPVNCSVIATDPDTEGDTFTLYYKWYNSSVTNGSIFMSSVLDLSTPNWNKGNDVGCLALVNDGYDNSSWIVSTTNGTIQNSVPTTPTLVSPADGAIIYSKSTDLKTAGSTDSDLDTLFFWYSINNTIYGSSQNYTYTVSSDDYHNWSVLSSDNSTNSSWASTDYFTIALPPYFTDYSQNSTIAEPKIMDHINLSLYIHDDSAVDFYRFSWNHTGPWVNGSWVDAGNAILIKNWTLRQVTYAHARVGWKFWANDSRSNINSSTIKTFTLKNTAPRLNTNPKINDSTPIVDVPINCTIGVYEDIDLDPKSKDYWKWYSRINNTVEEIANQNNYVLDLEDISEDYGDLIICSQRVDDGSDNSTWYNSSSVIVTWLERLVKTTPGSTRKKKTIVGIDILTEPFHLIYKEESITAPLTLKNSGGIILYDIDLEAETNTTDLTLEFTQDKFEILRPGQEVKSNLIITSHSDPGYYEILIKANVKNPPFSDYIKLFINLMTRGLYNKTTTVRRVTFAKDLFKENPECLEFNELLNEAERNMEEGNYKKAIELTGSAVEACRVIIVSREERLKAKPRTMAFAIITIILTLAFIGALYKILKPRKIS